MKNNNSFLERIINPLLSVVNRFMHRPAFCINDTFYTYREFDQCVSNIRNAIRYLDKRESYVGLIANDDIETYSSVFALWLEGRAYVPLHPSHPVDRSEEILRQVNIATILNSTPTSRFSDSYTTVFTSNLTASLLSATPESTFNEYSIDDDVDAYVLFTSGSTGTPKGVRITRKNIAFFMDSFWQCGIDLTSEDKCLQCFDLTFDVSVQSFLAPLLKGACVYTVPHDQIKYSYVYGLLEDHGITFGAMAPSMVRYMKPYFEEINIPNLKYCILTGEASPIGLVEAWKKCIPNAEIFDFYGPTETTIYCTHYHFIRDGVNKILNGMLSIGKPMANVKAIIVDEDTNVVADGEKGELCIAGEHVSQGYWNQPEKNKTSFFEKEISGSMYRFYRTGDLCLYGEDKNLMLFGRLDSQTKIQGYRVELGEIEFHAREFLKGNNAVVLTSTNSIGNTELVLFIEGLEIEGIGMSEYLKAKLPFYMIPARIIFEREFPLNSNGKIDKRKLNELAFVN